MSIASTRKRLLDARRVQRLLRFHTRFEKTSVKGYVLDVGPTFVLLAMVDDTIRFDGFECFRVQDLRDVKPEPHAAFVEAALRKRGERLPRKPRVSLADPEAMVRTAARVAPMITIHLERIDPEVCFIGRVEGIEDGWMFLREIDPAARWDKSATPYRLKAITRIGFGSDYEGALHLVGGEPGRVRAKR
jgi:hypothetical protein